ncbi:unnamed protein product [Euphydryas editha]|uniref:Ig-like domain-containing protein n=1 Tax=Euphydryas editha TaxID=104508 RepID=A0AAU9TZD1_EUPED|nr:unnamed protein product [Euphydryas editha]
MPVYQWIVSQKPQDMGILRGRVDLTYRASNDPLKMHRALRIMKPNTDNSGDYTCVVSTFMEEDSKTKQMIVFGLFSFGSVFPPCLGERRKPTVLVVVIHTR